MHPKHLSKAGLSLLELVALVAVIALTIFFAVHYMARSKVYGTSVKCHNNLKNVGLAFRIYASDCNDLFPQQGLATNGVALNSVKAVEIFRALSNELSTPKIVMCPMDNSIREATNWTALDAKSLSYFASLSAESGTTNMFLAGDKNLLRDGNFIGSRLSLSSSAPPNLSWSAEMHVNSGNILFPDGRVAILQTSRLKTAIRKQGAATNLLAMPGY